MSVMDEEIIVYQINGSNPGTSIVYPTGEIPMDEYIKTCLPLLIPPTAEKYIVMTNRQYNTYDHDFHKTFEIIDSTIQVNIPAARNIIREKLRPLRDAKFAPLDVAFMRAVERGDTAKQQEIATEKQKLRDITVHPAIDAATTLDELRDLTVDKLLSITA